MGKTSCEPIYAVCGRDGRMRYMRDAPVGQEVLVMRQYDPKMAAYFLLLPLAAVTAVVAAVVAVVEMLQV